MVAGTFDLVLGLGLLGLGAAVAGRGGNRDALPLGLVFVLVGVLLVIGGLGRLTARLEVRATVCGGAGRSGRTRSHCRSSRTPPSSRRDHQWGGSWAGFLGGGLLGVGFFGVFLWWLAELAYSVVGSEPTLGGLDLVVMKRRGGPVEVKPISVWSTRSSNSQANQALDAVKTAIAMCTSPESEPVPHSRQLLHDEWEPTDPGEEVPSPKLQPPGE